MPAPFADFVIPPLLHSAFLLAGAGIIIALLYGIQPAVTQRTVIATVPWVVSGAILHVFYQVSQLYDVPIYPIWAEPLFSAPAVYLTTFLLMGAMWLVASVVSLQSAAVTRDRVASYLAATGLGVMLPLLVLFGWQAISPIFRPLEIVLPVGGLVASFVVGAAAYLLLGAWRTYIIAEARWAGFLVVFAHAFDGITTAIGAEFLPGFTERSVLPRLILDIARDLPTYPYIGAGWLFVVVKLALALAIVALFADYVIDRPRRGNLLFAAVAAVGLGPALNNFFLFLLGV